MMKSAIGRCCPAAAAALVIAIGAVVPGPIAAEGLAAPTLVKTRVVDDPAAGVTRTFFGEVVARETVVLGFQVAGQVIEFTAPEGEILKKGVTIARLDPVPFEIAVERAELAVEQTRRQLDRYERLAGRTISAAQIEDARTELRMAEVALRNAEYELEQSVMLAPFDAMVASRSVANFSAVAAGTQIVRLHDLSEFRVDIDVPEVLVQQLSDDSDVSLRGRFPGRDEVHSLVFREMNAETAEIGQTFRATLAFERRNDRLLLPGASMVVEATIHEMMQGIDIPVTAVATDPGGQTSVFVVVDGDGDSDGDSDGDGGLRLKHVPVELTVSDAGEIQVADGLRPGDEIVVGGVDELADGQPVRRFSADF